MEIDIVYYIVTPKNQQTADEFEAISIYKTK